MTKPYDTRLIMMVAQAPFEHEFNQFCKLIPIAYVDGEQPLLGDFLNDGEVWWMLTALTARLAEPGRLVTGMVEDALRYDENDPASSCYQVKRDSVQELDFKEDGMQVIDLPGDAVDNIQDLVSAEFRLDLPIRPTPCVLIRWRSYVFGPFIVSADAHGPAGARQRFSLAPASSSDMSIYRIEGSTFDTTTRAHRIDVVDKVSMNSSRRSKGFQPLPVTHELLLAIGYEAVLATSPERLVLEPINRKLLRYAKQCLTRKKRQEFHGLLQEIELTGRETEEARDLVETVSRVKQVNENLEVVLDAVAKALLDSGMLGADRIASAERAHGERYIQERTAELQAKVEESLAAKRDEMRRIEGELKDLQLRLQKEEALRRVKLEQELTVEQEKARWAIATEREEFERQKTELKRQQSLLQQNLEKVTQELRVAGDEVVNRFLMIAPLLGGLGWSGGAQVRGDGPPANERDARARTAEFEIPAFITGATTATDEVLSEEGFFTRFRRVVEDSGFTYRLLDLLRFHVSVKCGEITVLAGPSGTGKSSLPAFYAQALLGGAAEGGRAGCLMVNINPSWMDTRDLLGHMNTLEGRFYPSECGLFQHLVLAHEEEKARGAATGMYLVCLDEMNLSQVEHYFSDFMMVLERTGSARTIQCFAPEIAGSNCSFRRWGQVTLSPALRFIGTVNFDETTRLLSDRFLDRVNLIQLTSAALPNIASDRGSPALAAGRMVTLADVESWCTDSALPAELGTLLDQIRPHLSQMGYPISPRVYRGICRFVGSSLPLITTAKALDLQVAQRIIPRIRSLVTKRQLDALDKLRQLLDQSSVCSFEESIPMLDEIREGSATRRWDLEE